MDWQAVFLSFYLATITSFLLLAGGLPLAYWLAFSSRRIKVLVEALVALPMVLPPVVLGFYLLLLLGPNNLVGATFERMTGHRLVFTFEGLVLASVLYSLPFAVQPFVSSFAAVDKRLIEASRTLGVSNSMTFIRVILPLSRAGILSGMILAFAHTLGEFGVVLMVGGNIPGETRTLSMAIYDDVQMMNYSRAGITSGFLLFVSFAILAFAMRLRRTQMIERTP